MASSVLQVRVEDELHAQAAAICEDLGLDLQTAVMIFLKKTVRDRGLPFEVTLAERAKTKAEAVHEAMRAMSKAAEEAGIADMSLDEINAEIEAVRAERRARMAKP